MKCQSNSEIQRQYKKKYQENSEFHKKKPTKSSITNVKKTRKVVTGLRVFVNK